MAADRHHDDRRAVWLAAAPGAQETLVDAAPDRFFRPPYVGHRGWLGVQLRAVDQDELAAIALDAYRCVAPKTLLSQLEGAEGIR
jgi:hypothetical protein